MEPSVESLPDPRKLPRPYRLSAFSSAFARVKTATVESVTTATIELGDWFGRDEWMKRFGNRNTIIPADENRPFLDLIMGETDHNFEEIQTFLCRYPSSNHWESLVERIQTFCQGAESVLDNYDLEHPSDNPGTENASGPKAWVSDCNPITQGHALNQRAHNRVLGNQDFYQVLTRKRFSEDCPGRILGNARRIYIKNPDGVSVLSLVRTAPLSQVDGIRELFAGYLSPIPVPKFALSDFGSEADAKFVIAFDLPFLAINSQNIHDDRVISRGQRLRACYNLDFLCLADRTSPFASQENPHHSGRTVLHEAIYSLMVTGHSEHYWTAICLDDDFFDEDSRLTSEDEIERVENCSEDPIILQAELGANRWRPRSYSLAALAKELEKIVDYHKEIQESLKSSIDHYFIITGDGLDHDQDLSERLREWRKRFPEILGKVVCCHSSLTNKVKDFLVDNGIVGPKESFQAPLWRSLEGDEGASRSLRTIKTSYVQLRDIDVHLQQLREMFDEVRRVLKDHDAGKQKIRERNIQYITVAAFARFPSKPERPFKANYYRC